MQGAHTDGVRAAQWVGPPPTWLTSGLGVGPLKTQLKSTAHHCQLPPHPKPRTPRQQMPHCSPSWPSRRDSGSFPRPAGLLTNPASHSRWRGPGQRWWQGLGTAGRGRGPFVAEPPNRMRRCPLPAPSLPSSACASRLHPGPPPPSHRRLLVHLGLGLGWGGRGKGPGHLNTASLPLVSSPACSPHRLKLLQTELGALVTVAAVGRETGGCLSSTKSVRPAAPSPSNGLPLSWHHPS